MRLRTDDRGVTVQIGTVLLFAVLIVLLSTYQATVVPQQNEQVEFNHNQRVQSQLQDLRGELLRTATTGRAGSASVALGTRYPVRAFFVNPPSPSGSLRTTATAQFGLDNAVAVASAETRDYWDGNRREFATSGLVYEPNYNVYRNPPTTSYQNTVLYNRFDSATQTVAGQRLVRGDTISLVALTGRYSEATSGTASVNLRPVSPTTRTVTLRNAVNDAGEAEAITLVVPTTLSVATWRTMLDGELDPDGTAPDKHVTAVESVDGRDAVRIVFEPGVTYELKMAKVGVGTGISGTQPHYVTVVRGNDASVAAGGTRKFAVEVRDRFNNPVSGATVNVSSVSGGTVSPQQTTTDADGRATFVYEASDAVDGTRTVEVSIDDGSEPRERATVNLDVETGGDGSGGDGAYQTLWDISRIESEPGMSCYDANDTCRYDRSAGDSMTLTAETVPKAVDVPVEFGVNDTGVATFASDGRDTGSSGRTTVSLDTTSTGTVNVYAWSGGSGDDLTVEIYGSDDGVQTPSVQFRVDDLSHVNENRVRYIASYDVSNTNSSFERVSVVYDNVNRGASATGVNESTDTRGSLRYALNYGANEEWNVTVRIVYENSQGEEYVAASESITDTADALNPDANDDLSEPGSPRVSSYSVTDKTNPGQGPWYRISYGITTNGNFTKSEGAAISLGSGGAATTTKRSPNGRVELQPGYGVGSQFRIKFLVFGDDGAVVAVRAETDTAN